MKNPFLLILYLHQDHIFRKAAQNPLYCRECNIENMFDSDLSDGKFLFFIFLCFSQDKLLVVPKTTAFSFQDP